MTIHKQIEHILIHQCEDLPNAINELVLREERIKKEAYREALGGLLETKEVSYSYSELPRFWKGYNQARVEDNKRIAKRREELGVSIPADKVDLTV